MKMIMIATVLQVDSGSLLVRDMETGDEVLVIFRNANRFNVGDRIRIFHNGQMTLSIPPQIAAISIQRIQEEPQPEAAELSAIVLRRSRKSLLVRDMQNNAQIRVNYAYAYHFCIGQQIVVRYETIRLSNPAEVEAIDIMPVC